MNKITSNALWIIICKVAKAILVLVTTMLIARQVSVSDYGLLNYAQSLVKFVTPIMQLGFDAILVYKFIRHPEKEGEIFGSALTLNVISSIFCIGGVTLFAFFANGGDQLTTLICFAYSLLLVFQALEMIQYWFQAKLISKYASIAMLISYMVLTGIQILIVFTTKNIIFLALSYSLDYLIISVILIFIYRKKGGSRLRFSWPTAKDLLKDGKFFIISSLMITIFATTDKVMLKHMVGDEAVGFYSAAVTCASMTAFVFAAIIDSFRSTIYEKEKISEQLYEESLIELYSIITYLSLLQSIVMTALAWPIIYIMYGSAYYAATVPLQIIVWYTTFSYLGSIRIIWIISKNKNKYLLLINGVGAALNVGLNFLFIPLWGINGAAIASLITQIFTNFIIGFMIPPIMRTNILFLKSLNPKYLINAVKKIRKKENTIEK